MSAFNRIGSAYRDLMKSVKGYATEDEMVAISDAVAEIKSRALDLDNGTCIICGGPFQGPYDRHNPWPVALEGQCCGTCNETRVIPARLRIADLTEQVSRNVTRRKVE